MKTCVFIVVVLVVGLSRAKFPGEKTCCLSSKTPEKNVCKGRMIGRSTEMARVAEVDRGNFVCVSLPPIKNKKQQLFVPITHSFGNLE